MVSKYALNVKKSASDKAWVSVVSDPRLAEFYARQFDLPDGVANVLAARIQNKQEAAAFLSPRLRDQLPDPFTFLDMERAVERVEAALQSNERIAIFADYDVDGATSGALLQRFLSVLGADVVVYVPDREKEGYGPNPAAMNYLKESGCNLVLTLDCGATAFEAIDAANEVGLDVIVLDHHVGAEATPNAVAVVNPNRADEISPHTQLAAVGVVFLFVVALRRKLEVDIDLMNFLDLVALGTVADVAPLTGVNRALVAQGLRVMAINPKLGIAELLRAGGVQGAPKASHMGFVIGPRINAGGRIGRSELGVRLLSTDDPEEAAMIASELDNLNRQRQQIERSVFDQALEQADVQADSEAKVIAVSSSGWRQGVVGIVASRLVERFRRPALVAAIEDGIAIGSGRSVSGVALGPAIIDLREEGLLISGGGHNMAAGFRVAERDFKRFVEVLSSKLSENIDKAAEEVSTRIDAVISPRGAYAAAYALERLSPFGMGNPEPRFALAGVRLKDLRVIKNSHLAIRLEGPDGFSIPAMSFRSIGSPLGDFLQSRPAVIHAVGRIEINTWRGRDEARLVLEDAALAN